MNEKPTSKMMRFNWARMLRVLHKRPTVELRAGLWEAEMVHNAWTTQKGVTFVEGGVDGSPGRRVFVVRGGAPGEHAARYAIREEVQEACREQLAACGTKRGKGGEVGVPGDLILVRTNAYSEPPT